MNGERNKGPKSGAANTSQTCTTAVWRLTTPTAESGFNIDRNVTLLASMSFGLSLCSVKRRDVLGVLL